MDRYITVGDASLHKALTYGYTTEQFNLIDGSHYKRVLDHPVYRNIPFQERRWMSERWTWETLFPHESHLFPGIKPRWHSPPNYLGLPDYEPATVSLIVCVPAPVVAIDPLIFHNASASASLASSSPSPTPTPITYLPKPARIVSQDIPLPSIEAATPTPTPTPTPKPPHLPTLPRAIRLYRHQTPFQPTDREWTSGWSPISPQQETFNHNLNAKRRAASPIRGIKRGRAEIDEVEGSDCEDSLKRVVKKMRG